MSVHISEWFCNLSKLVIFLADLTHKGPLLSSNVFPLSIGLIAGYLAKSMENTKNRDDVEIELFKYPEDLSRALEYRRPNIVGFANYSWNFHLSYAYSKQIKAEYPETAIVFGGPNYGLTDEEVSGFWASYPLIDFHIVKEGEEAFAHFVRKFVANDKNCQSLKEARAELPNCHYVVDLEIVKGPTLPRLKFTDLPSPYLMGFMDKFFDNKLVPMIHTTRGCPFSCAFCTEGAQYFNIVEQRPDDLKQELNYISSRIQGARDLFITDANFGMFKSDMDKAKLIAECQDKFAYPENIYVSTGKNQKERVVEVARILKGALCLAASLQSTDPIVLENVSRSNISVEKLADVGLKANQVEAGTYSELILGLPGDNVEAHRQSLRDTVEAGFDNIRMYQLIMLPQTEINTPESRKKYKMHARHRILPRSFGTYKVFGRQFVAVESEEIMISNDTMTFDDYLLCREMDLAVEILHNGNIYAELQGLSRTLGVSWFDFIMRVYDNRQDHDPVFFYLFKNFKRGMISRLWKTRKELENEVARNVDAVLGDERGTNEISTAKATAFFQHFEIINAIVFQEMTNCLNEAGLLNEDMTEYLKELERISFLRKSRLTEYEAEFVEEFSFNMPQLVEAGFCGPPKAYRLAKPQRYKVNHQPRQRAKLEEYTNEFGNTIDGLGKMLMRHPHMHRVFRQIEAVK